VLNRDVISKVRELKKQILGDLVVIGSGELLQALMKHELVDELLLTIHPIVLGTGRRLFPTEEPRTALTDTKPTTTGVIIAVRNGELSVRLSKPYEPPRSPASALLSLTTAWQCPYGALRSDR
jgi:dihydrofolate reductase